MQPLCFVLMPRGTEAVYERAVGPALAEAGLKPVRTLEERPGSVLDRAILERLLACDYAVIDLTRAGGDVLYQLGLRHALRPGTTVTLAAHGEAGLIHGDILGTVSYELDRKGHLGDEKAAHLCHVLTEQLHAASRGRLQNGPDAALFQLLGEWSLPEISRLKTDVFRDRVRLDEAVRAHLAEARSLGGLAGVERLRAFEAESGALDGRPFAMLVDLLLSYRAVEAWDEMVRLVGGMPIELRRQVLVREQLAFALNRRAGGAGRDGAESRLDRGRALALLAEVDRDQGPSGETSGLIGRIHKDEWDRARTDPARATEAAAHLDKAIAAYVRGFEADARDAFPGINALTLLDIRGDEASLGQRDELLPVVRYAARRRLRGADADYWDHATLLELAVLASDEAATVEALPAALSAVREAWEPATTARNLGLLREAREARGIDVRWVADVIAALEERAASVA